MAWNFITGAPADARRALPVFSLTPNWKSGVLERLAWLTDVMSSEIAVEQRRSIRLYPRRSFEVSFLRAYNQRSRLDNFLAGMGRKVFMVPLWHEQFKLGQPTGDGTTIQFPSGSLKYREFRLNDLLLLSAGDPDVYAILTVITVNLATDRITVRADGNIGSWPVGSRITPMRRARIMDQVSMDNPTDRVGTTTLRFDLSDADSNFVPSWGYCAPLFRYKPDRKEAIRFSYERSTFVADFDSGVVEVEDPGNRAQISTSMAMKLFGRPQVADFRAFLYMARGRAVRFYVPSFTEDLRLAANVPYGPTFTTQKNGFSEYMSEPQEARRIISFVFKDGRPTIYRNVTGVQPVLDSVPPFRQIGERFTVAPNMPPIRMDEIERLSFVVPSRFDQDTIEIFHATDESAAVSSSLVVRSSVVDGMPPIECWVTSRPYPVVTEDQLGADAVVLAGGLYEASQLVLDNMTMDARVTEADLRALVDGFEMLPENMRSLATLLNGDLKTILKTYDDALPENMTAAATLTAGTIRSLLITYTMQTEFVKADATLTGGTLT